MRFIDIGANLTDRMYSGEYNGSSKHPADLQAVIARAQEAGVEKMIVTGGSLEESRQAVKLAEQNEHLVATVGCHPTRCGEFEADGNDPDAYFDGLMALAQSNKGKVVAVGEIGLDYDRTKFCEADTQQKYLLKQLNLSEATRLPLFLHCRAAAADLVQILTEHREKCKSVLDNALSVPQMPAGGVVHSFDGSAEERDAILALGLYIGVNGCSLKTEDNLEVVKGIPGDKLLLETDCPWCDIRPSHAGYKLIKTRFEGWPQVDKKKWREGVVVKGRNEPHNMRQVLEVVAAVREEDPETLADTVYNNTLKVFFNS